MHLFYYLVGFNRVVVYESLRKYMIAALLYAYAKEMWGYHNGIPSDVGLIMLSVPPHFSCYLF